MLFRSVTAGVGLLLIIPLLQVIGIAMGTGVSLVFTKQLLWFLKTLHLPLNLVSILLCYVLVITLVSLVSFTEEQLNARLQERYVHHLRATLHAQILQAKWPFLIRCKMSDLLHGITALVQSTMLCHHQLLILLNKALLVIVYTALAFMLSWKMTLAAIGCSVFLLSLMLPLHRLTSVSGARLLERNQSIFQAFYEQLGALKMIKSANFEAKFIEKGLSGSTTLISQTRYQSKITAASKLFYSFGSVLCFSFLLYVAIETVKLPVGSLLLLLFVFGRLLPLVSGLQQTYQLILRFLPSYCQLKALQNDCLAHREARQATDEPPKALKSAIVLKNVSFSYQPGTLPPVIKQVSLQIKKNTTTAIIGPSGAGKTTLTDLIVGLLEPTSGHIYIDEEVLTSANHHAWRKSLAYVTQDVFLFNASIRENLQLLCENATDACLWDALRKASAAEFVAGFTEGLDTLIGDRGVRLSGGEAQRIALARALLMKPQLLILDESTSSLDNHNIHIIQQALRRLHGEMTILIVSHQTAMHDFADQVIQMDTSIIEKGVCCVD